MSSPFTTQIFNNPEHVKLLADYLDDRALEPSDFPEGLVPIADRKMLADKGYNASLAAGRPYIFLKYLDPYGKPYGDEGDPYQLARFLGPATLWSGKEPPPKVIAQNNRANVLHFEPIQPLEGESRDWHNLKDGQIVVHVESMVKARAVHKWTGFPTIGYNGVSSYSSSKRGVELLHTQYDVDFTRLTHVVLFDSNVWKPEVQQARLGLMFKLKHVLGCKDVRFVDLPKGPGGQDWGPDDYIRNVGNGPLIELITGAERYIGEEHDDLVAEVQERAIYCTKTGTIIDRLDKVVRTEQKAVSFYAPINKKVLKGKATVTVTGFPLWRESKDRTEVLNPGYEYLGGEFIERDDGRYYNLYQRSGPWPDSRGGAEVSDSPVIAQLVNMMSEHDLDLFRSYLKYLKLSGRKPTSFPVLFSDKRGVGKGWASKLAYRLIGAANTTNATAKQFVSNFNAQLANKRLVIVNEFKVRGQAEKDAAMNSIKTFFGDEFITIEPKGVDSYQLENRAGMIITCNALEDIPTDGLEDRRMWYIDCTNKRQVEEGEWPELHRMVDDPNVLDSFFHWVAGGKDVDFSSWKPPLDETKIRAVMAASSSLEGACYTALHDLRDTDYGVVNFDTVKHLLKDEFPQIDTVTTRSITIAMRMTGWEKTEKRYGRTPNDQRYMWIVHPEKFKRMNSSEIMAEVDAAHKAIVLGTSKY